MWRSSVTMTPDLNSSFLFFFVSKVRWLAWRLGTHLRNILKCYTYVPVLVRVQSTYIHLDILFIPYHRRLYVLILLWSRSPNKYSPEKYSNEDQWWNDSHIDLITQIFVTELQVARCEFAGMSAWREKKAAVPVWSLSESERLLRHPASVSRFERLLLQSRSSDTWRPRHQPYVAHGTDAVVQRSAVRNA